MTEGREVGKPEFSVFWTDPEGLSHREGEWMHAADAVKLAHSLSTRPGAVVLKIIREIKIVDGDDFCVFWWKNGAGVVYPPREEIRQQMGARGDH